MESYKGYQKQYSLQVSERNAEWNKVKIQSSRDAAQVARQYYSDDIELYESMFMLILNRANNTTGYVKISQGGVAGTMVDPIIVAKYAIDTLASAVILVHNHPSGNLHPSGADLRITEQIKDGLKLFNIQLFDHLILTAEDYYSMADHGDFNK